MAPRQSCEDLVGLATSFVRQSERPWPTLKHLTTHPPQTVFAQWIVRSLMACSLPHLCPAEKRIREKLGGRSVEREHPQNDKQKRAMGPGLELPALTKSRQRAKRTRHPHHGVGRCKTSGVQQDQHVSTHHQVREGGERPTLYAIETAFSG